MKIKTIELQYDDRHPDKKVLINKKGHKFHFSSNSELVDFLYEAKELHLPHVVAPRGKLCSCGSELITDIVGDKYCGNDHCDS